MTNYKGKFTIDRIENDIAVLLERNNEDNKINVKVSQFPVGIKQGDIILIDMADGVVNSVKILEVETKQARIEAEALLRKIRKN